MENFSTAVKTAYNKGWASTAKTLLQATNGMAKRHPDATLEEHRAFSAGYTDKHEGNAKWLGISETIMLSDDNGKVATLRAVPDEAPTQVEVDGVVVAVTKHVDLTEAAAAPESEEELAAEVSVPDDYTEPTAAKEAPRGVTSIPELLARITKDMDREDVKTLRAEISMKKRHYIMGWNSFSSTVFKGDFDAAQTGYFKRHGAPAKNQYFADWESGWNDHAEGAVKGASWVAAK